MGERKTILEVFSDLLSLFNMITGPTSSISNRDTTTLYIHKQDYEREKVLELLENYFNDVKIIDGYLEITSMTLIYTTVKLIPWEKKEHE